MKAVKIFDEDHEWVNRYAKHYCVPYGDVVHRAINAAKREIQRRDFKRAENVRLKIK